MEHTKSLLTMVLQQHYRDRPEILIEALDVIKDYPTKDSTENEYEEILNTLKEKMSDLPIDILLYFLSMVPLPKSRTEDSESLLDKEMEKCGLQSFDNIRLKLLEYLNAEPLTGTKRNFADTETESVDVENTQAEENFIQPRRIVYGRRRRARNAPKECKRLLDICTEYVIKNQLMLNEFYKRKRQEARDLVCSDMYVKKKLYEVIEDVNRKTKLMRMIECEEISRDIIYEEYENNEVFLRESNLYEIVFDEPFELSKELQDTIANFIYK